MIEYMDVVNDNDVVIGSASREEIYKKCLTHRIVHVLIFDKTGKMALQLRSPEVSFCPNHWSTAVGGHVQTGESYEQAALREFREELGVAPRITFFKKDVYKTPERSKFLVTFKCIFEGPFNLDKKSVSRVDFFSMDEIKKMIKSGEKFHPELLFLLEKHYL